MARRGKRKAKPVIGDPSDPFSMGALMLRYLEWLRVHQYSARTVENREKYLTLFIVWCEDRAIERAVEVTKPIVDRYQRWLYHETRPDGKPLSARSQQARLIPIKGFFKWLTKTNHIAYNPASELELPKTGERLPRVVLTANEAEAVLSAPDITTALGLRDRAMLELLYSTGMRRSELAGLKVYDIEHGRETVMIREGKGKKDRVVPVGERTLAWVRKYEEEARPELVGYADEGWLFVTAEGLPMVPEYLTKLVAEYIDKAAIGKRGSCHVFRHTCATLMLEGGADIRFIQQMLGHARLETTQIYTRVSIARLKAIHDATHPGAKLTRTHTSESDDP